MTVWITRGVFAAMCAEARVLHPVETGGILLGWRSGKDRVIADMRGPGPNALHGRCRFCPDHRWQVGEIRRAYEASRGDLDYLGDWHTHPDGVAAMSGEDTRTLSRISRRVSRPLIMILANEPDWAWTAGCWTGERKGVVFSRKIEIAPEVVTLFDAPDGWSAAIAFTNHLQK